MKKDYNAVREAELISYGLDHFEAEQVIDRELNMSDGTPVRELMRARLSEEKRIRHNLTIIPGVAGRPHNFKLEST